MNTDVLAARPREALHSKGISGHWRLPENLCSSVQSVAPFSWPPLRGRRGPRWCFHL